MLASSVSHRTLVDIVAGTVVQWREDETLHAAAKEGALNVEAELVAAVCVHLALVDILATSPIR